ncbi:hypothetical protein EUGRSUZ_H04597, partial [Eucalyptus grandis]
PPRPLRRRHIKSPQDAVTAIERCRKPVLAAVHGACVGGGVDLATACDVRYCTEDAFFSVKEVDLAITADLGTLQRLPTRVSSFRFWYLGFSKRIKLSFSWNIIHMLKCHMQRSLIALVIIV